MNVHNYCYIYQFNQNFSKRIQDNVYCIHKINDINDFILTIVKP